jgi:hypothetical protein
MRHVYKSTLQYMERGKRDRKGKVLHALKLVEARTHPLNCPPTRARINTQRRRVHGGKRGKRKKLCSIQHTAYSIQHTTINEKEAREGVEEEGVSTRAARHGEGPACDQQKASSGTGKTRRTFENGEVAAPSPLRLGRHQGLAQDFGEQGPRGVATNGAPDPTEGGLHAPVPMGATGPNPVRPRDGSRPGLSGPH